jgi:thiol:disulfide interchange protein DsbD
MLTKTGELKTPSFTERSPALVLLGSYLLGLLLAFTPCVLPMIPIVSGIIVGQKKPVTKTKSFLLSACYVLSMSLTYALIGLLIALSGKNLQVLLQTPLVIVLFSALFVLLAFSLFGYFDLKLPESLTNRLSKVSQNQSKGAYLGAAIMGALATLILTPCVSAPLVGLLGFIAQSGNLVIGALGLFMLSLGMGTPLILVAVGAGAFLPNTGRWMNEVKNLFGVMMLGLAIYTLSKLISSTTTLYLSGLLLIGYGWQCRPLTRNSDSHTLYRTLGFASILYGALLIIGGAMGNSSFFTPLKSSCYEKSSPRSIQATKVQTLMALNEKLLASNRPSLVYFSANWCTSCHLFRKNVLETADIQTLLSHFNYLEVDLTKQTPGNQQIMAHYNVVAPPTTLFFVGLDEISKERLVGETNRKEFKQLLEKILLAVGK